VKGHELLIDGMALACEQLPSITGFIGGGAWAGDWAYQERLQRRARMRSRGRIVMPGALSHEDAIALWPEFDIVVHVPLSENCGGIHEAMIAGTPVAASATGGLPELIEPGVTGWLVPRRSPDAVAATIMEAFKNREESARMAANGAARVSKMLDVERTGREVLRIYDEVLSKDPPQGS